MMKAIGNILKYPLTLQDLLIIGVLESNSIHLINSAILLKFQVKHLCLDNF